MSLKIITSSLTEDLVYWPRPRSDGRGGYVTGDPEAIKGRWNDVEERIFDDTGEEVAVKAKVEVGVDIDEGGFLFRGALTGLQTDKRSKDPTKIREAKLIQRYKETPTFKGNQTVRVAYL